MTQCCCLCATPSPPLRTRTARAYHQCPACDLIFVPRKWHLNEDAQRARYAQHHNSAEDAGYMAMLRRPLSLLRQFAPGARRVLDYGCGREAVLVDLLGRDGYRAVGYDPLYASDAALSSPFHAVIAVETFEHFADPRGEMDRIQRLLAPSGCLIVVTLLHQGPEAVRNWWYARDPTHVAFYSSGTMAHIAKAFGFAILFSDSERILVLRAEK